MDVFSFDNFLKKLQIDPKSVPDVILRRIAMVEDKLVNLSNLDLIDIPEDLFTGYEEVQHINMSDNQIENLPGKLFSTLPDLISLDLSYSISPLNLSEDDFVTLPEELLSALAKLLVLDVSGNQIEFLPEAFFDKQFNLEVLNLSSNLLALLPTSIGNCINLEELYVVSNFLPLEFDEVYTDYMDLQDFLTPFTQAWQVMNNPVDMINELGIVDLSPDEENKGE